VQTITHPQYHLRHSTPIPFPRKILPLRYQTLISIVIFPSGRSILDGRKRRKYGVPVDLPRRGGPRLLIIRSLLISLSLISPTLASDTALSPFPAPNPPKAFSFPFVSIGNLFPRVRPFPVRAWGLSARPGRRAAQGPISDKEGVHASQAILVDPWQSNTAPPGPQTAQTRGLGGLHFYKQKQGSAHE
jgi:hypothetical protein